MKEALAKAVTWVYGEKFAPHGISTDQILADPGHRESFLECVHAALEVDEKMILTSLLAERKKAHNFPKVIK